MRILLMALAVLTLTACNQGKVSKDDIKKALKEDPTILAEAVKANPVEFMDAVREAAQIAQANEQKRRQEEEKKKLEAAYDNPLVPTIRKDENFRGPADAPITLVEYSDFECPFCARAYQNVNKLIEKYGDKIRFVYKHMPLSFHPNAMEAAKYHEAIRLQDSEKAWKFHDKILTNLSKVRNGEKFFKAIAKELKVDMAKLAKDKETEVVKNRIEEDLKEAEKFGFRGTPGFVLNGVPVRGALPPSHFSGIIDELVKRGKLKI